MLRLVSSGEALHLSGNSEGVLTSDQDNGIAYIQQNDEKNEHWNASSVNTDATPHLI